jgi:DNA polymerase III epsilon subunit-like protein
MMMPPLTDLDLAVRAFSYKPERKPLGYFYDRQQADLTSDWEIIFDTETTTDNSQKLRIGICQVRKSGKLQGEFLFVADDLPASDLAVAIAYCDEHNLELITVEEFRHEIILKIGYHANGTIIGHNLPYDIARIATDSSEARLSMRGGFRFEVSPDIYQPNIRVKQLNPSASLIDFAAPAKQFTGRGMRKRGVKVPVNRGCFIDTKTISSALLTGRFSLKRLCKRLGVATQKHETEEHGGPLSFDYIDYARADVQATWECYSTLKALYASYGLDTPLNKILSEASIGKALLKRMGIKPYLHRGWDGIAPDIMGALMATFFGGRAEVRNRRVIKEVFHCDFKSMYPTNNALLGLHEFLIADSIEHYDATEDVRSILRDIELEDLQKPETWKRLCAIVKLKPRGDVLPARAQYDPDKDTLTIGLNHIHSDHSLWYTLPDVIASKLLTGQTPIIEEAIGFRAGRPQKGLRAINLLGREDFHFDPTRSDMFVELINMRDGAKAAKDAIEKQLKILANSACYGIFAEVIRDDHPKPKPISYVGLDGEPQSFETKAVEEPGKFFNPLLATLITGSSRLMLACAECVAIREELDWAFCDTDSIALARTDGMSRTDFHDRAKRVVDWFAALNPYNAAGSILQPEKVNYHPKHKGLVEPLYCWAISAKRYSLFNLSAEKTPIIRKASAHGLGHLMSPYDETNPAKGVPDPSVSLSEIGVQRWQYDYWYFTISAALNGTPNQVRLDFHPALKLPAIQRYTASSPALLHWMKTFNEGKSYADQAKPFGFMAIPMRRKRVHSALEVAVVDPSKRGRPTKSPQSKIYPVAPFDRDPQEILKSVFCRESGEPITSDRLETYAEALATYHLSSEMKFDNGERFDRGRTERRHVRVRSVGLIGKEANKVGDFGEDRAVEVCTISFDCKQNS